MQETVHRELEKFPSWRSEAAEMQGGFARMRETVHRELERARELGRSEASSVHAEVMSVNTRVAAIEEKLAAAPLMNTVGRLNGARRNGDRVPVEAFSMGAAASPVTEVLGSATPATTSVALGGITP